MRPSEYQDDRRREQLSLPKCICNKPPGALVGLFDIFLEVLMTDVNRLPALVSLQHLGFQFANGETLLHDLTLSIDHTPTGIVGRNGQGKSILAQLIAGHLQPSSGTLNRSASVAYVPQNLDVAPGDTIAHLTGTALTLAALERMASGTAQIDDLELIDDRWDLYEGEPTEFGKNRTLILSDARSGIFSSLSCRYL